VSAFYASNRAVGLAINGYINFRSKYGCTSLQSINQSIDCAAPYARLPVFTFFPPRFMGNSSAAIMDGEAVLYFLRIPGESYTITFPTAYARGALLLLLLSRFPPFLPLPLYRTRRATPACD
jgi:hypothetical protein